MYLAETKGMEKKSNQTRICCWLPRNMSPSKSEFESIGFTFMDIDDDVQYQARLPQDWSIRSVGPYHSLLIDEKGRERGTIFYKAVHGRTGCMKLSTRFNATYNSSIPNQFISPFTIVAKDFDNTDIFVAGDCSGLYTDRYEELMDKTTAFLSTHYPDWRNPIKYWD